MGMALLGDLNERLRFDRQRQTRKFPQTVNVTYDASVLKTNAVVNIATVKHLSPFRYPGGKTWLVPHVMRWLSGLPERPSVFIEPFAGGELSDFQRLIEESSVGQFSLNVALRLHLSGARC